VFNKISNGYDLPEEFGKGWECFRFNSSMNNQPRRHTNPSIRVRNKYVVCALPTRIFITGTKYHRPILKIPNGFKQWMILILSICTLFTKFYKKNTPTIDQPETKMDTDS
jgi:hypothetical protein